MTPVLQLGVPIKYVRPNGVAFLIDSEGRYHGIAAHNEDLILGKASDILGATMYELMPHALADLVLPIIQKVIASGSTAEYVYTVTSLHAKGKRHRHAVISRHVSGFALWGAIDVTDLTMYLDVVSQMGPQEHKVWLLSCRGYSLAEISRMLDMSERSVSRFRSRAYSRWR